MFFFKVLIVKGGTAVPPFSLVCGIVSFCIFLIFVLTLALYFYENFGAVAFCDLNVELNEK